MDLQLWKGVPRFFWTNLYDWDHWTSHAMCTCIGVIHWYMYMKKKYEMIWMNIYICHAAKLQTCSGDQKNPWHVVFDSQRKPKKNAGHRMVSAHAKKPSWVTARLGAEMDGSYFWVVNLSNLNAEIPPGRNAEDFWGDPLRDAMACWSIREKALLALTRRILGSKHLFIYPPHLSSVCID